MNISLKSFFSLIGLAYFIGMSTSVYAGTGHGWEFRKKKDPTDGQVYLEIRKPEHSDTLRKNNQVLLFDRMLFTSSLQISDIDNSFNIERTTEDPKSSSQQGLIQRTLLAEKITKVQVIRLHQYPKLHLALLLYEGVDKSRLEPLYLLVKKYKDPKKTTCNLELIKLENGFSSLCQGDQQPSCCITSASTVKGLQNFTATSLTKTFEFYDPISGKDNLQPDKTNKHSRWNAYFQQFGSLSSAPPLFIHK